ncbi:hypothetical protein GCM10022381_29660 [Leifsonia kafniensis]|uniref:Copper resistance protein CopC n=1 Tax=Leifsonia kafniensis TaxID=475957 RepID=A0ABP7KRW0_9MICO
MAAVTGRASRLVVVLFASLCIVLGLLASAPSASAHGGTYELSVSPDGAGGLTVLGHYGEDQHVVEEIMDPIATATSADGRTAGPVSLVSSSEGQGVWVTAEPFIPVGDWTVTVSTTVPSAVSVTAEVTVAEPAAPVEAKPVANPKTAAPGVTTWLWFIAGAVAIGVAVLWLVLARAKRQRA